MKGNATYGVKKELVDGGMIDEYIKALGEQDLNNLRVLMNDVLSGESIHNEWKESRIVLVHKGGSKQLKTNCNYKCNRQVVYDVNKI